MSSTIEVKKQVGINGVHPGAYSNDINMTRDTNANRDSMTAIIGTPVKAKILPTIVRMMVATIADVNTE